MLWSRFWCQTSVLLARTQERLVLSWQSLEQDYLCLIVMLGSSSWSPEHCRASEAVTVSAVFTAGSDVSNVQPNLEEKWVGFAARVIFPQKPVKWNPRQQWGDLMWGCVWWPRGLGGKVLNLKGRWVMAVPLDPLPAAQPLLCASGVRTVHRGKCHIYIFICLFVCLFI